MSESGVIAKKMLLMDPDDLDQESFMMMARFNCVIDMSNKPHTIEMHNALVNKFKKTSYKFKDNCPLCEVNSPILMNKSYEVD